MRTPRATIEEENLGAGGSLNIDDLLRDRREAGLPTDTFPDGEGPTEAEVLEFAGNKPVEESVLAGKRDSAPDREAEVPQAAAATNRLEVVLEIFAGSARFSQCCALSGLKVGTPVDIRTGFDVMTSKGRHMVMEIIKGQAPDVILMARSVDHGQVCRTSNKTNKRSGKSGDAIFPWLSLWHPLHDIS